jgi:hypothetical protein
LVASRRPKLAIFPRNSWKPDFFHRVLPILLNMTGEKKIAFGALLVCCLLAVAPGCFFQRAERGTGIYSSAPSLEGRSQTADRRNLPVPGDLGKPKASHSEEDKPELLPWRSHMKSHLFNGRFAQSRKTSEDSPRQGNAKAVENSDGEAMLPSTIAVAPSTTLVSSSARDLKDSEDAVAAKSGPKLHANRPDLVAE